jgi:hypothetical protein
MGKVHRCKFAANNSKNSGRGYPGRGERAMTRDAQTSHRTFPRLPAKRVYLLGTGESVETPMVSQMADFTSSRAFRVAGAKAFAEAGITHNDVDCLTHSVRTSWRGP